jgi:hypothetical protein
MGARSTLPGWLAVVVVVGALLLITGAVIALLNPAMLVGRGEEINPATRVYAGYLFSRNTAIAVMLLGALSIKAARALSYFMVLAGLVQIFDALIEGLEGRWTVVPGVVVIGIAFFTGAHRACGKPLWKADSWRDLR